MKCPVDGTDLTMSERQGIEIDYCPKCRGVWLDRGELDKIIERSESAAPPPSPSRPAYAQPEPHRDPRGYERHDNYRHHDDDDHRKYGYRKRRKGLLGEIFDFD